ncbi:MAG: short-chain dehydrogenase [Deltaproteobacteria bacterium]|nr:short-chain dehydrogenase [Deltaproteobacteria bacterium]HCH65477.1 short-chain dehydrogenase [Deltaproteobacteria bacterium]
MNGQVCVVTGATSGIGLETARGLASLGAHVVLTARTAEKGNAAIADIRSSIPDASLEVVLLDLADLSNVRFAGRTLREQHPRVAVLVNNAGVFEATRRETVDGFESTFGVNHLGPYLFTRLLLPALLAGGASRVVNVTSEAHRGSEGLAFDDLDWSDRAYSGFRAYADSKLANLLFTRSLSKRFDPERLVVHAVHPGSVATGLFEKDARLWVRLGISIARYFLKTPAQGAVTSLHAAAHEAVGSMTGGYFVDSRIKTPSRLARDDLDAGRLWHLSAGLVDMEA